MKWLNTVATALIAVVLPVCAAPASAADVVAVLSRPSASQTDFVDALAVALTQGGVHRLVRVAEADEVASLPAAALVVAVGLDACRSAVTRGASGVLGVFLSRRDAGLLASSAPGVPLPMIVLNQPIARSLALARELVPDARRVALMLGTRSATRRESAAAAIRRAGFEERIAEIASEHHIVPALERLLADSDVLLALPDAAIYNRNTVMSILLTSYRQRRPVIGFTASYVRAGAVAAVFSSPADIALQAAEYLARFDRPDALPSEVFEPTHFRVAVNQRVARSLGLPAASGESLALRLRELERAQ